MKRFNSILVATDMRLQSHPIVEEAAEIAQKNNATLKIVDVIPDFPWVARLMVTDHEEIGRVMGREKKTQLEELAAKLRSSGINVETKILWGRTSVEIIREVMRGEHDLVMRVAKGHESTSPAFFGATGRSLLRDCPCPVWLVAENARPQFQHVMACVDTSTGHESDAELNETVYELAAAVSQYHKAHFTLLHAWHMDAESILSHRMAKETFDKMLEERKAYVESRLDNFLQSRADDIARPDVVELIKSSPPHVIPPYAKRHGVDLVVMGTVARSGVMGMVIGNTAERILNELECSVLAIKPNGFVSPITPAEYVDHLAT